MFNSQAIEMQYIKVYDMRKKNYSCICVDSETFEKIESLSKICQCSKTGLMAKVFSGLYEIASIYETAELESYPLVTRSNCLFQLYGKNANLVFGKLTEPL
jgi:hypothetical protein